MIDLNSKSAPAVSGRLDWHIDMGIAAEAAANPARGYLGASILGDPCERAVQYYSMRAARDGEPSGTKQDIFERGHWIEALMIRRLRAAGFLLADRDPLTGEQFEATWLDGRVKGHPDGLLMHWLRIHACPIELPALWECKGLGSKWWKKVVKDGLRWTFPSYFGQMQLLMGGFNLSRGLFTAVNADTMERYHATVDFDSSTYTNLLSRAERIFLANQANELLPRAFDSEARMECRMCNFSNTCWG